MRKVLCYTGLLLAGLILAGCAAKKESMVKARLPRSYQMDINSDLGLIYGKIIHNQSFGKTFVLTFRNNNTGARLPFLVEAFGSDAATDIIIELEAGEWFVHQITSENKTIYNIEEIRGEGNKEFILDKAGITYVGTWTVSPAGFESKDEKEAQDTYIRSNYKNVMPSRALVSIP